MTDINQQTGVSQNQDKQHTVHHPGNFADADEKSLQLSGVLQSTLELGKVLELFCDETTSVISHQGMTYNNEKESYHLSLGNEAKHRCSYKLTLLDKNLGLLIFYRDDPFQDNELIQLETLIAALIYPLRNAILYKRAIEKAHKDPVTGVSNRTAMDVSLFQEVDLARRHSQELSIILLDIDKFKHINDTYGHIAGDTILKRVADSMSDCVRGSDIIYRYGGEEFVIVLRSTNHDGANLLAERLRAGVESMHENYDDLTIKVTVSAGVTTFKDGDDVKSLIERCDKAMYQAKQGGRNQVVSTT